MSEAIRHSIQSVNPQMDASTTKWGDLLHDASMTLSGFASQLRPTANKLGDLNQD